MSDSTELTGVELIAAERATHEDRNWTASHDDTHHDGAISQAAACYAAGRSCTHVQHDTNAARGIDSNCYQYHPSHPKPGEILWPWGSAYYNPGNRIEELTKAGGIAR